MAKDPNTTITDRYIMTTQSWIYEDLESVAKMTISCGGVDLQNGDEGTIEIEYEYGERFEHNGCTLVLDGNDKEYSKDTIRVSPTELNFMINTLTHIRKLFSEEN